MKNFKNKEVYLVSDYEMNFSELCEKVEEALKSGTTILQYRAKNKDTRELCDEAMILKEICEKYNCIFIINDRVDIALVVDADGVHLGQKDMKVKDARKILGENKIIGASTKNVEEAKIAVNEGADYLGVGALFETNTKKDADYVTAEMLGEIKKSVNIPIYGIGGITDSNLTKDIINNIDGVAVVSVILKSLDINATVTKLKSYFKR